MLKHPEPLVGYATVETCSLAAWNLRLELSKSVEKRERVPIVKRRKTPLTMVAISTDQCTARVESVQGLKNRSEQT